MKHQNSSIACLVLHTDKDGNVLPQCIRCSVCGQWIRPEDMNKECPGPVGEGQGPPEDAGQLAIRDFMFNFPSVG